MKRLMMCLILGLLGVGLFFVSVAMAAPVQPLTSQAGDSPLFDGPITDTNSVTSTTTVTHPVASAMAAYFGVDDSAIGALHQEGYGFGVIAHAYFIAEKLDVTPRSLLDEFDSGKGWGVILKEHDLHPGRAGRGGNLGDVMSGRGQNGDSLGAAHVPPGQRKKGQDQPGGPEDTLSSGEGDDDGEGHGPPTTPPGQDKGKGSKGKKG